MWVYLLAGLMMLGGAALVLRVVMRRFKIEKRVLWNRHIKYHPPPPRQGYKLSDK